VLLSAVQFSSGSQTKQSEEPLVIYPQEGCQPDQNPGFYTTGLVLANKHRNLDALNLMIALDHAAAGIAVFPVTVLQGPDGRWKKRPAIKGWRDSATTDPDQIRKWWREFSQALPGLELGRAGLVVIDADRHERKEDGVQAFAGLRAEHKDSRTPKHSPLGAESTTFTGSLSAGLSAIGRAIFLKE
jgi:hypothetical protein